MFAACSKLVERMQELGQKQAAMATEGTDKVYEWPGMWKACGLDVPENAIRRLAVHHRLFVCLSAALQLNILLASQFSLEEDPKQGLTYYAQYEHMPKWFSRQYEMFLEMDLAVLVALRGWSTLTSLVLSALGYRTAGSLLHLADAGGFGMCFHLLYESRLPLMANLPFVYSGGFALIVILTDPAHKTKEAKLCWMEIYLAFAAGAVICVWVTQFLGAGSIGLLRRAIGRHLLNRHPPSLAPAASIAKAVTSASSVGAAESALGSIYGAEALGSVANSGSGSDIGDEVMAFLRDGGEVSAAAHAARAASSAAALQRAAASSAVVDAKADDVKEANNHVEEEQEQDDEKLPNDEF